MGFSSYKQSQGQGRFGLGGLMLLASVAIFLVFTGTAIAADGPIGKIISITGSVEYHAAPEPVADKGGQIKKVAFEPWQKAKPHQAIYASDEFRTSRKSRLKVLFADKSLMALGPNAQMKVESYIYKPKDKLRQSVINVAHGLSMYIVNKSNTNKKSSFKLVTPTANLAARGTQGYLSVSALKTIVANQASSVEVGNSDATIPGHVIVGAMMKTIVAKGKPPTEPTPLTIQELNAIRRVILAQFGPGSTSASGASALIRAEDGEFGSEEDFAEFFELFNDLFAESCTISG